MIKKVYLLWHAYRTKELLVIGSLMELDNKKFMFKYETDAEKALKLGCFLPFRFTNEELYFDSLPHFFEQRILKSKFNIEKSGINYDNANKLEVLTFFDSVKNNDNFRIISEHSYYSLMKAQLEHSGNNINRR